MKKTLLLDGLDCAHCAGKIEKAVSKLDGVESAQLNFMVSKLVIEAGEEKMEAILEKAAQIVKKTEPHVVVKRI